MPILAHPPFSLTLFPLPARPFCFLTVSITVYMSSLQQADLAFIASLSLRVEPFGLAIDCPTCGGTVPIMICVSDKHGNAGKPMAKHPLCSYYHFFPLLLSRLGIMALIPSSSSSPTLASSSTLSSSAPSLSQAKKTRKRGAECTTNPCRRPRALWCPRGKCLSHRIEEGGCVVHEIHVYNDNEQDNTVDGAGFGYQDLHNALSASLAAQGLEVPPSLPAIIPSLHDILHAPPPPPPSLLPAPSTSKTSKHPRITSQLDPLWEQDLHQRAQQEIEDNQVAQRHKEMELKSKQCFILNWFDVWVSNCPFFPFFQLADDPDILSSLGENITKIEVFKDRLQQWIPAKLTHNFPLESECHIFIHRFGVTSCRDFDELYDASRASMRPAHLCYNMKRERDGIRMKIKAKRVARVLLVAPDSDLLSDDVKIVDDTSVVLSDNVKFIDDADNLIEVINDVHAMPRPTNALGKRAWEHSSPAQHSHTASPAYTSTRPRFDDWDSQRASSMSPTPSLSPSPAESSTSVSSISLVSAVPSVIPVHVPSYKGSSKHVWPHGMFTCDMVVGFCQMDSPLLCVHYPQEELFGLIFSVPYVCATYHSNHALWVNSCKVTSILQVHERAHCTPDGLWAHYLSSHHAALGKKTKKRSGPKFK
ncbi:uncharacterized protein EDB91DRAFT_1252205 [Suillus paluster]|uniref:uncharacterized protein n=1 Tax=Suillus paluster TaxID=48578 RepID=UPI001B87CC13|nr:uncharacterized protein EDB91DRAFT_1252205 [Suillus paluster]KAG1731338.1 hypothetical protein EDB91DRAFT_1252205 [Suillus paluster]